MHFHPSGAENRMRAKANMEFSQCFKHLISSAGVARNSTEELLNLSCNGEGDEAQLVGKRPGPNPAQPV